MKQAKPQPIDPANISPELLAKCSGPDQFERFDALVGRLFAVPREKIVERREEYEFHSALNPNRRGPKRKRAYPAPVVSPQA
jgi:hypothetical protein